MADDRSLADVIRFVDPSGDITDADIASITKDLKFTEVLDIITAVGKDDLNSARNILSKHDQRFVTAAEGITNEYSSVPVAKKPGGFKPIKPIGSTPTIAGTPTNPNGPQQQAPEQHPGEEASIDDIIADPANKNKPEVRQIQSLLQRMQNR